MRVVIHVGLGESHADAKELERFIRDLNFTPYVSVGFNYASDYGAAGHLPLSKD